jgi:hypothetical protein
MHFSSHLKHSADSCYTAVYIPTGVIYISTNVPYISTDSPVSGNYTTIQDAVNNATSGETIIVYPEIYTENVNVSMADLNIISYSGNPDDTVVKHLDVLSHDFKINANNVTISGFNITGTYPIFRSIFIFLFIL